MAGRRVSVRLFGAVSVIAVALLVAAVWGWRAALREENGIAVRIPLTLAIDT
jgi:hypothetical protein